MHDAPYLLLEMLQKFLVCHGRVWPYIVMQMENSFQRSPEHSHLIAIPKHVGFLSHRVAVCLSAK
jgi:hypothetical protein